MVALYPIAAFLLNLLKPSFAGQCSWSLIDSFNRASISIEKMKPNEPQKLMKIKSKRFETAVVSVVSEPQLKELFEKLKQEPLAYAYPEEGCYARAHLMAKKLEQWGILSAKLFALGNQYEEALTIKNPYSLEWNHWLYHVAPIIIVQTGEDSYQPVVLDPSLSARPLSMEEWLLKMTPPKEADVNPPVNRVEVRITERFEYFPQLGGMELLPKRLKTWNDEHTVAALEMIEHHRSLISADRAEHWKHRMRSPSSIATLRDVNSIIIRERAEKIWIGFKERSAYYFISKTNSHWQEIHQKIKTSRENQLALELTYDPVTLELK